MYIVNIASMSDFAYSDDRKSQYYSRMMNLCMHIHTCAFNTGIGPILGRGTKNVGNHQRRVSPTINYFTTPPICIDMLISFPCSYLSFHTCLSSEAQKLPAIIQQELDSYDSSLCKYLGVDRAPPKVQYSGKLWRDFCFSDLANFQRSLNLKSSI